LQQPERNKPHPVDSRVILYRMTRQVAAIVAIVFLLKLLFVDIIPVRGNQMAPAIRSSDRVLMLRLWPSGYFRQWLPGAT